MPRNGLLQAISITDVLQSWSWGIIIPRIPGVGDTRSLTSKCISTSIPSMQVEPVKVEMQGGIQLNFAGRRLWGQTFQCTFIESRDSSTRGDLLAWMNLMRNPLLGIGAYKSVYAVPIELALYDDAGLTARSIKLVNSFPTDVGESSLDQTSGVVQYSVTFSYDFTEEN
jgi:hypothetical protein